MMQKRKLGRSSLEAAPLAFGCNVFGWTINEARSFELLDAFVDAGFNLIDTADSYARWVPGNSGGESETIIGNWLRRSGKRAKVLIATKVGSDMGLGRPCLSKHYILDAAEASLRRLGVDCIDLYQSHFDDPQTPVGETMEAYAQLIQQGKVRVIGASNLSKERLQESLDFSRENNLPRYETLQPEYNLYDRETYESQYETLCHEEGLGVLNYFSLASGFLTGKYRSESDLDKSTRGGGMTKYLNGRGFRILEALDAVAQRYATNPATVALAWVLARPGIAAPIASATSVPQLEELTKAADLQLDEAAMVQLNNASRY